MATPIADLVEHLFAAGATPDTVIRAIKAAEQHASQKAKNSASRGTRIPDDWRPTEKDFQAWKQKFNGTTEREIDRFKDYWRARPGKDGLKLDWDATGRNWVRSARLNYQNNSIKPLGGGYA